MIMVHTSYNGRFVFIATNSRVLIGAPEYLSTEINNILNPAAGGSHILTETGDNLAAENGDLLTVE